MEAGDPRALLRDPGLIRARSAEVFGWIEAGRSRSFGLVPERLEAAADLVVETIREAYPTLAIPFHSRWRHLGAGGVDRWAPIGDAAGERGSAERARVAFEVAIVSVLLDAGAGAAWRFEEPGTGKVFARSEGLAVASVGLFRSALARGADAASLRAVSADVLGEAFQVTTENPLDGLEGRAGLLARLGGVVEARQDVFGPRARLGGLFDHLAAQAKRGALPMRAVLGALLDTLGPIWPGRLVRASVDLGDTWEHQAATDRLVPFHKLSQWLAYSLVEPLEEAGVRVVGLDELTGLAEYRNGGLFVDTGVLALRDEGLRTRPLEPGSETVVEWRAATIVLLDRVADLVRARLGRSADELPLLRILEGGTWAAGRRIASRLRPGGPPPLAVASDGTVF